MIWIITFNKQALEKIIHFYWLLFDEINSDKDFSIYKNDTKCLIYTSNKIDQSISYLCEKFNIKFLFYFWFSIAISNEHIVWDIILPNIFMEFDVKLSEQKFISKENRDKFMKDPIFLENYTLQKDYNFWNFWFSVWGICISWNLKNDQIISNITNIRIAYEADIYDYYNYSLLKEVKKLNILNKFYIINIIENNLDDKEYLDENIKNGLNILKFITDSFYA